MPVQRQRRGVRFRGEDGNALIEIAMVMPVFLAFITGIGSFAIALGNQITLIQATGSGGEYLRETRTSTDQPLQGHTHGDRERQPEPGRVEYRSDAHHEWDEGECHELRGRSERPGAGWAGDGCDRHIPVQPLGLRDQIPDKLPAYGAGDGVRVLVTTARR